ncbi:MAG TPA: penicillin acylase family protein [Ktedonobacteraceae bacterium]
MASWWKKTFLTAASLSGFVGGTYSLLTRRPVPQKSGTLHLDGVHEPIEIITDRYGVPHIYANNEDDLYFAQGYMHAQERLWQMELNRRIGSGQLSEIFGPIALETDRFCRRLGLHRIAAEHAKELPDQDRRILEAYSSGVNTFINVNSRQMPVEFTLLGITPEPWKPAHTIQWGRLQGWSLSGNWETELIRARLVAKMGVERAVKLEAGYDPHHPLIIPPGVEYSGVNADLLEQYKLIQELSGFGMLGGSNNWAVDGTMTETGAAMLCNDPHLGQAAPSIWYECHLVAGDLDVTGASFPGSPGIIIGHNQYISWGVTNAVSDIEDLYIEKFNPDDPSQYEFMGQWEEAQVIHEEIKVKGWDTPVIEEVRVTRHGPIITATQPDSTSESSTNENTATVPEPPMALRWPAIERFKLVSAVHDLNYATNWDQFRDALRNWDVPPQNFVYADCKGNIGYVMAGAIPIRARGQAILPSPGWTGEYEWTGFIPFDELPQTYNPEQHFIVTANNRVVDDAYPYYITHEWLNGYRAQRIRDLLTSKGKLTLSDMATIQADQYSIPATEIVPSILELEANTPLKRAAQEILQTWDYVLGPDSIGATIYSTFLRKLTHIVFETVLGDDSSLVESYLGIGAYILANLNGYANRSIPLLIRLIKERDDNWFADSVITNGPTSWNTALERAFDATIEELREHLSSNILLWQYGLIHKMTFRHPLGAVKALESSFNRGPFPFGGDSETINMGNASPANPEEVVAIPSYRQIVDLGNLNNSLSIHVPGQSGHPASKHYDDFIQLWRETQYHPQLFKREAIEAAAEGTLHLLPKRP